MIPCEMPYPRHVVGIGASAGGIEALCVLLSEFTHDATAFVVVTHLPPDRESALPEVLARYTAMEVRRSSGTEDLQANCIYVAPEFYDVVMASPSQLALVMPELRAPRHTIDRFFRSLAHHCGRSAVGVVLSGANTDGTEGLEAIRAYGGATYVQDWSSAQFERMPRSAAIHADVVAPPATLGQLLMQHVVRG